MRIAIRTNRVQRLFHVPPPHRIHRPIRHAGSIVGGRADFGLDGGRVRLIHHRRLIAHDSLALPPPSGHG